MLDSHVLSKISDLRRAWAPGLKEVAIKSAFPSNNHDEMQL